MRGSVAIGTGILAICAACARAQRRCDITNAPAPSVVTLIASPTAPETQALVVYPNCTYTTQTVLAVGSRFTYDAGDLERIESVPSKATNMMLLGSPLSEGFDLSAASDAVRGLGINAGAATAMRNSRFPQSVSDLNLEIPGTTDDSIATTTWPSTLNSLSIHVSKLKTVPTLPSTLRFLKLEKGRITAFDFAIPSSVISLILDLNPITSLNQEYFPPALQKFTCEDCELSSIAGVTWPSTLTELVLSGNPITRLYKVTFPPRLGSFYCEKCPLTSIRGVQWPSTITKLYLGGSRITEFEIRESDVAVFEKLSTSTSSFDPNTVKNTCSDTTVLPKRIGQFKLCIISDARFRQRYNGGDSVDSKSSSVSASASSSASGSSSASSSSDSSQDSDTTSSDDGGADGSNDSSRNGNGTSSGADPTNGSRGANDTNSSTSTTSSAVVVVAVVISVGITASLALVGFQCLARRRRARQEREETQFDELQTSLTASDKTTLMAMRDGSSGARNESLKDDIREDPRVAPFRIEQSLLQLGRRIARGGFGVIYTAEYNNQVVAVKQLASDAWRDDAKLYSFMDEIRMCVMLQHPKIVSFIGVTWSSLRDISVVIEFMDGGDLHVLLQKQPVPASPQDWFQPWTASKKIKSKTLIAQDVAEAVVYLHSFNAPIIHRDLKARNVLLDTEGNAKLSDFGISRELNVDATMTSEIGTVAWIAPEVLQGGRYNEKADIYSLGVLLVELDRCRHPYADGGGLVVSNGSAIMASNRTGLEHQNAQVAVLVGAGLLKPSASSDSPASVQELVSRCVQLEPSDRPSAAEVLSYLQQATQ